MSVQNVPNGDRCPFVAIVIVNYRGRDDTLECLQSLQGLTYPRWRAYLVDQASADGTPAAVRDRFPNVVVIENAVNNGFAGGNNCAIRQALEDGAVYVFLLNNDTTVAPDLLDRLVNAAEAEASVGILGPIMLYHAEPEIVWSTGGRVSWRGEVEMLGQGETRHEAQAKPWEPDYVVGCGMLLKRVVLEQIGLLDDQYFLYYEETDLSARARRAGWGVKTVNDAVLWHKVSRSTGTDSDLTLYYMRRNVLLYLWRNAPHRLLAVSAALADTLRLSLVWRVQGRNKRAKLLQRAMADFLRGRLGRAELPA